MQADRANRRFRWLWPDSFESLLMPALVGVAVIMGSFLIPSVMFGELVTREPDLEVPAWASIAWAVAVFVLSGAVTMWFRRRQFAAASGLTVTLRRAGVLAFVCVLCFFIPLYVLTGLLGDEPGSFSLYASDVAVLGALWLCWVAGGLAGGVRRGGATSISHTP